MNSLKKISDKKRIPDKIGIRTRSAARRLMRVTAVILFCALTLNAGTGSFGMTVSAWGISSWAAESTEDTVKTESGYSSSANSAGEDNDENASAEYSDENAAGEYTGAAETLKYDDENTSAECAGEAECADTDALLMQYMSKEVQELASEETADVCGSDSAGSDAESAAAETDQATVALSSESVSESAAGAGGSTVRGSSRGGRLSGNSKKVYSLLADGIAKIAAGQQKQSAIDIPLCDITGKKTYTAEDLGLDSILDAGGNLTDEAKKAISAQYAFDLEKVYNSLLTDLPFDLYWHDKTYKDETTGKPKACYMSTSISIVKTGVPRILADNSFLKFMFAVSSDYSKTGETGTCDLREDISSVTAAVQNAAAVISAHARERDLKKLASYRDEICSMTMYDTGAESKNYGDPWQMIYVFDGDDSTDVVCEGYAKAFQFLFDNSDFSSSELACYLVTGYLYDGASGRLTGKHMWNILHMNDGKNYMADITNCDPTKRSGSSQAGSPDRLFLKGCSSGSVNSGYYYLTMLYTYTDVTRSIYDDKELKMSSSDYSCPHKAADLSGWTRQGSSDYKTRTCGYCGAKIKKLLPRKELVKKYTPGRVSLKSAEGGSKNVTLKWKRIKKNVTGYQICVIDRKTGKKTYKKVKASKKSICIARVGKLRKNKRYRVKVRAYRKARGYTFYGKWSKLKSFGTG